MTQLGGRQNWEGFLSPPFHPWATQLILCLPHPLRLPLIYGALEKINEC